VNSTVLGGDPISAVRALKSAPGRDIVVTGSIALSHTLIGAALVDEYRLFVHPAVQGAPRQLSDDGTAQSLRPAGQSRAASRRDRVAGLLSGMTRRPADYGLGRQQAGNSAPMLIRRVARPMLARGVHQPGCRCAQESQACRRCRPPDARGPQKLPDPLGANVPRDAETFARVNAAVQIGADCCWRPGGYPGWLRPRWRSP